MAICAWTYPGIRTPYPPALYLCEAACYYRSQGKSLMDVMTEIYETYGYQEERADTLPFPGPRRPS